MDGNPKRYIVLDPHQRINLKSPACGRVSKRIPKGIGAYPLTQASSDSVSKGIKSKVSSLRSGIEAYPLRGAVGGDPGTHL